MRSNPVLYFVYFEAGGGHRSAATALQSVAASQGYPWDIRLMNLQEVLDPLDVFRKLTGIRLEDLYNLALAKGWTLGSAQLLKIIHGVIRLYHSAQVRLLEAYWREHRPNMVVSLIPNFNRAIFQSLQNVLPGTPFVTIPTDLADWPPHFWMERQDQFMICGSAKCFNQAQRMGYRPERIFRTSGMILRPHFYSETECDARSGRERLGLQPDLPTGLVLFGGEGSNVMYSIAQRLGNSALDLQLILICGRNAELRSRLQALKTRNKIIVEGFTKEIPFYMRVSDFFIGKPGPGSVSEAMQMGLPVVVERNAWTLPQERFNADWIREQGVGVVLKNFRQIDEAVAELLRGNRLAEMKARIGAMDNQAVFEIPKILESILRTDEADRDLTPAVPAKNVSDSGGSTHDGPGDRGFSRS